MLFNASAVPVSLILIPVRVRVYALDPGFLINLRALPISICRIISSLHLCPPLQYHRRPSYLSIESVSKQFDQLARVSLRASGFRSVQHRCLDAPGQGASEQFGCKFDSPREGMVENGNGCSRRRETRRRKKEAKTDVNSIPRIGYFVEQCTAPADGHRSNLDHEPASFTCSRATRLEA